MRTWFAYGWLQIGLMIVFGVIGWSLAKGGSQGWRSTEVLLAIAPASVGVLWLMVWGHHTQHLFVNVLVSMILLNVLFAVEAARRRALVEPGVLADAGLVQSRQLIALLACRSRTACSDAS